MKKSSPGLPLKSQKKTSHGQCAFPVSNPFAPRTVLGVVLRALGVRFADGEGARAAAREVGPVGQHLQTFDAALGASVGVAAIPLEEGEGGAGLCGQFGDDDFLDMKKFSPKIHISMPKPFKLDYLQPFPLSPG